MIRLIVLGVVGITAAGCAGQSRYASPIVDMRGVDPTKYANDVGECTEIKRQLPVYADGGAISKCMAARGYTVIDPVS
jgi:hypothetical protein